MMECGAQCVMMMMVSAPLRLRLLADNLVMIITAITDMLDDLGRDLIIYNMPLYIL